MTELVNPWAKKEAVSNLQNPFKAASKKPEADFKELAEDYNVLEKGLINMGYGFDRAYSGAKQAYMSLEEKVGTRKPGSADEYTEKKNKEYSSFEDDEIAQGIYAKGMQLTGEILPAVAIPAPLSAIQKASLLTKVGVEAVTGSAFGYSVYADSMDDKQTNAMIGTVFGAAVPVATNLAGKAITQTVEKTRQSKATKIQDLAQKIYNTAKNNGEDLTKVGSIKKAIVQLDPDKKAVKYLEPFSKYMNDDSIAMAVSKQEIPTWGSKIGTFVSESAEASAKKFNNIVQPISSSLRDMGLINVATQLNKHDMNLSTDLYKKLRVKDNFAKSFDKLSKNEQKTMAMHLNNGTFKEVQSQYPEEIVTAYKDVRRMLDETADQAVNAGMAFEKKGSYFPREFDYKTFANDKGISLSQSFQIYARAINKKYKLTGDSLLRGKDLTEPLVKKYLTNAEISKSLADNIIGKTNIRAPSTITGSFKRRTIDKVAPENMKYYSDPRQALTNYITRATTKIHDRNFFGGKAINSFKADAGEQLTDDNVIGAFIDDYAEQLLKNKSLLEKDADQFIELLTARFNGAPKPANKFIAGAKNILYSATLGNPMAAGTQLGDLGSAAYINGVSPAIKGVIKAARNIGPLRNKGDNFISMEDFGLDAISHEFEHLGTTAKILDWSLKWGGFKTVDRLGKESILNASFIKMKNMAKNIDNPAGYTKAYQYFNKRFGGRIDDREIDAMIRGFNKGDKTDEAVRLALFSDITKVQPISMSEMPKAYNAHPNARVFYMLKTFMLKQLDLVRNDVVNNVAKGVKNKDVKMIGEGVKNMAWLAGTLGLANASVEQARNWLSGKEVDFSDQFAASLMRNYGLSEYTLDIVKQGKPLEAAWRMALPPISVVEDPIRSIVSGFDDDRGLKSVPLVGRLARTWMHRDDNKFDLGLDLDLDLKTDEK